MCCFALLGSTLCVHASHVAMLSDNPPGTSRGLSARAARHLASSEKQEVLILVVDAEQGDVVLVLSPSAVEIGQGSGVLGSRAARVEDGAEGTHMWVIRDLCKPLIVVEDRHNCHVPLTEDTRDADPERRAYQIGRHRRTDGPTH